jgi:hypothetical protein
MKTKTTKPLALVLVTIIAAALPAAAQPQLSDTVIYTPTSFSATIPENNPQIPEFLPAFAPAPNVPDQAVLMYEQGGTTGNLVLSDALWVQAGFLYFESDVNDVLIHWPVAGIPVVGSVTETGNLQDLGILFKSPTGAPAFQPNTLLVASDVDQTPEPSTLALLGIGGAAGAFSFLRRRKA